MVILGQSVVMTYNPCFSIIRCIEWNINYINYWQSDAVSPIQHHVRRMHHSQDVSISTQNDNVYDFKNKLGRLGRTKVMMNVV